MKEKRTEPFIATYLHNKGGLLGLPISGTFELTARCNFSCPMCYVHQHNNLDIKQNELTAEQWITFAKNAKDAGMMFALITGGEPFLREDFFEIYDAMKDMGLMISINSNGSLIKGEILKRLISNPPFRVNISLYGACSETYKKMCKNDAFASVINSIRALKDAGIDVRLNLSLTPYNKDDLEGIFNISEELGVHIKCNTYMYPPLRLSEKDCGGVKRFSPSEAALYMMEWDKLRLDAENFRTRCENILNLCTFDEDSCEDKTLDSFRCRAGRSSFWITWEGNMLPCGMMQLPVADAVNTDFLSAWEYIKKESRNLYPESKCNTCDKRKVCNHCAAVCVAETGSFGGVPEYMCRYTEALIERACKVLSEE